MEELYGLAHLTGWEPNDLRNLANLYSLDADPAQHLMTADTRSSADDVDRDLFEA